MGPLSNQLAGVTTIRDITLITKENYRFQVGRKILNMLGRPFVKCGIPSQLMDTQQTRRTQNRLRSVMIPLMKTSGGIQSTFSHRNIFCKQSTAILENAVPSIEGILLIKQPALSRCLFNFHEVISRGCQIMTLDNPGREVQKPHPRDTP